MKIVSTLFILVFALLLASCTQTENNISPVAPNLTKVTGTTTVHNGTPFPFPLFTTFKSYANKGWNSSSQFNKVTVRLINTLPPKSITFAIVKYSAAGPIGISQKVMTYLDLQSGNQVLVPVIPNKKIQDITIYGLSGNTIVTNNYYYHSLQSFVSVKVDSWKSSGKDLTVSSSSNVPSISQLYAVVNYGSTSALVFMQKPSSQTFAIPNYGGSTVTSVTLFGLSSSIIPLGF